MEIDYQPLLGDMNPIEVAGALQSILSFVQDPDSPRNTNQWRLAVVMFKIIDEVNHNTMRLEDRVRSLESENADLGRDLRALQIKVGFDDAQSIN